LLLHLKKRQSGRKARSLVVPNKQRATPSRALSVVYVESLRCSPSALLIKKWLPAEIKIPGQALSLNARLSRFSRKRGIQPELYSSILSPQGAGNKTRRDSTYSILHQEAY